MFGVWISREKNTKAKKQKVNQRTDEKGCITWEVPIGKLVKGERVLHGEYRNLQSGGLKCGLF